jgi:FtsP/CotA-like multicopper oxidase with cupredoxin domain
VDPFKLAANLALALAVVVASSVALAATSCTLHAQCPLATKRIATHENRTAALVLRRGELVAIPVVNRRSEPISVHWHGIELESFPDGVRGSSSARARRTACG